MATQLTTGEAAQAIGVNRVTLQRWIRDQRVKAPETILLDGRAVRLWSKLDMARLSQIKQETYRKGRGRKPKSKYQK